MPAPANQCVQSTDRSGLPESRSKHGIAEVWKEVPGILNIKRKKGKKLLSHFSLAAERIIANGGHVSLEWPKRSRGWAPPGLLCFLKKHSSLEAFCDRCAFGFNDHHDNIMEIGERPWAPPMLQPKTVLKFKHSELEASKTGRTAFYTDKMAECISSSLYPSKDVPVMPIVPFLQSEHLPHEPLDLGDHQLIDRRDWHG